MSELSWADAEARGYKTTVATMTRNTVADGQLLNSGIIEPLSARDQYIVDECDDVVNKLESVKKTIEDNKDTNWPNKAISGFSAIKLNDDTITAAARNTDFGLASQSRFLSASLVSDAVKFEFPTIFSDSYRLNANEKGNVSAIWPVRPSWRTEQTGSKTYKTNNSTSRNSLALNMLNLGSKYTANIMPKHYITGVYERKDGNVMIDEQRLYAARSQSLES